MLEHRFYFLNSVIGLTFNIIHIFVIRTIH